MAKSLASSIASEALREDQAIAATSGADAPVSIMPRDDFDRDVWCLLGIPVDIATIDRALSEIDASVRSGKKLSFVTPNVNWLVRASRDDDARREILEADLSFVDGAPLVAMAKALNVPAPMRVAGADIFEALRRRPGFRGRRIRVFFFGGRDGAGEAAVEALNREGGGVEAVGSLNPGFGNVESMSAPEIIAEINEAAPDFVVVALGAAKGQAWIDRNKDRLSAPVISHLGAVVDFTGGGIARAPALVKKLGLEWAWRIKEEPALWRRYFQDAIALSGILVTCLAPQVLRGKAPSNAGPGSASMHHHASGATITLSGAQTEGGLEKTREAFRAAAAGGKDAHLDFSGVSHFDRAFLGLVLMLEKHVAKSGHTLYVSGLSGSQAAMFRANRMSYPVSTRKEAASVEAAAAVTA